MSAATRPDASARARSVDGRAPHRRSRPQRAPALLLARAAHQPLGAGASFGLAFVLYLIADRAASPGAPPGRSRCCKAFGLLMVAYFVGLLVCAHALAASEQRCARLRHEARELLAEIERAARAARGEKLRRRGARAQLTEQARAVDAARSSGRRRRRAQELKELDASWPTSTWRVPQAVRAWTSWRRLRQGAGWSRCSSARVVIEPFKIPSGSMIPTLQIGDQIFVNKFIYGVRIPFAELGAVRRSSAPRSAAT